MPQQIVASTIKRWGNGLAVRLNKIVAQAAGVTAGTAVRILAQPGRIIIETVPKELTLDEMLAAFDPKRHSGEVMAFPPHGREVL